MEIEPVHPDGAREKNFPMSPDIKFSVSKRLITPGK